MSAEKQAVMMDSRTNERSCRRKRTVKADSDFDFTGPAKKTLRPRSTPGKTKLFSGPSGSKYRSRRHIFKTNPSKLAPPRAFVHLESRVLHRGKWLQIGDIVSVTDIEGGEYYAQIRNIIINNSEDPSVLLTWLIPTTEATKGKYEPAKYIIGMEEDVPRSMNCINFLCHCPSEYFRPTDSPYSLQSWDLRTSSCTG